MYALLLPVWACALGAVLPALGQAPWTEKPPVGRPFEIREYVLRNGLRVFCQPRPDSESVVVMAGFATGSRNETPADSGISHLLEHMLFTGTQKWGENDLKLYIPSLGGQENGTTSRETTRYYAHLPAESLEPAAEWLDQLVFHPTLPPEKVEKEKVVIYQEMMGKYDRLVKLLDALGFGYDVDRAVERAIFPASSIPLRVIGEGASVERIDRQALRAYYAEQYVPSNGALVVVGGARPEEVAKLAEKLFGKLPPGIAPEKPSTPAMPTGGPFEIVVRGPWETDYCRLLLGARTIGRGHPDYWPLEVLGMVLEQSLTNEIRYKRGLVYGLDCSQTVFCDAGYFCISTESERASLTVIKRIAEEALEEIRKGRVDEAALARAKTALKGRWILSMENNLRRATWLHEWALHGGDAGIPSYCDRVDAVQARDLARVVNAYFIPAARFTGMHLPIITARGALILTVALLALLAAYAAWRLRRRRRKAETAALAVTTSKGETAGG